MEFNYSEFLWGVGEMIALGIAPAAVVMKARGLQAIVMFFSIWLGGTLKVIGMIYGIDLGRWLFDIYLSFVVGMIFKYEKFDFMMLCIWLSLLKKNFVLKLLAQKLLAREYKKKPKEIEKTEIDMSISEKNQKVIALVLSLVMSTNITNLFGFLVLFIPLLEVQVVPKAFFYFLAPVHPGATAGSVIAKVYLKMTNAQIILIFTIAYAIWAALIAFVF